MRQFARKNLGIVLATVAALFTFWALDALYVLAMGRFFLLTGIPTPGGAPLAIHVFNMGLKGGYAALIYMLVMRSWFGRVAPKRVAVLWTVGLIVVAMLGGAAKNGVLSPLMATNIGLFAFAAISLFFARDWVSK